MTSFLQSSGWELFQRSLGRTHWRIRDMLVIRHELPGGFSYLYVPRPSIDEGEYPAFIERLARTAADERAVFSKIDPEFGSRQFDGGSGTVGSHSLQPRESLILDLASSERDLLLAMHHKTRYNVKLAERHGVAVRMFWEGGGGRSAEESFIALLAATAGRDRFHPHPAAYYRKLLSLRAPDLSIFLALAYLKEKPLAGAIGCVHGDRAVYLHGASSSDDRNAMAPYGLHWGIITELKRRGIEEYDWWGIDARRWPGVTRFKLGFGGRHIFYPPSVDIIHRPLLYAMYRGVRALRGKSV